MVEEPLTMDLSMHIHRYSLTTFLLAMALSIVGAAEPIIDPLASEKKLVTQRLTEKPDTVILAVDGMCCRTCAIGIGKKTCLLEFVDTEALPPKGVAVDRINSLLTVSVKQGKIIDVASLVKAIRKAGYSPVRFYQLLEGKKLVFEAIEKK